MACAIADATDCGLELPDTLSIASSAGITMFSSVTICIPLLSMFVSRPQQQEYGESYKESL